MKAIILAIAAAATIATTAPATAQTIDHRENRQEHRIVQGERTGALTRGEARKLQHREMRLRRTELRMRSRNGGYLTPRQRARLTHMENRDSRAIARLKHNARHYG